jgi:hypothetical protein
MVALRNGYAQLSPAVDWFIPQPLWRANMDEDIFRQRRDEPLILRFAGDNFMDELMALLASEQPENLRAYVAQRETWQDESSGLLADGSDRTGDLKLFQPSHNRFYLVAGALACRIPGVPDRSIDVGAGESAFFVVRRLRNNDEFGWSTGQPTAPKGIDPGDDGYESASGKGWFALNDPAGAILHSEERFPLFPLTFEQDGVGRRMLAGLIPVASQETFHDGKLFSLPPPDAAGRDPRPVDFEQRVIVPLGSIADWYEKYRLTYGSGTPERRQVEHTLAYVLLDLLELLDLHVDTVYQHIKNNTVNNNTAVYGAAKDLVDLLRTMFDSIRLTQVLDPLEDHRAFLTDTLQPGEVNLKPDDEIGSLSGMAGVWVFQTQAAFAATLRTLLAPVSATDDTPKLLAAFKTALSASPFTPQAAHYPEQPKLDSGDFYLIRLVYERPACKCLNISRKTRRFKLASFFDPEAPVRPIRIRMPVDTSVEGLRKYGKGVSFMLSDQLQKQMSRIKGMQELLDGDVGDEPGLQLGMICSFSIPIITICALIVLMIFIMLLNIIFWWLPLFRICIPIPVSSSE